ncbi:MAG: Ig-like domain-containing protein [Gemmatimonadales bacterium]
MNGIIAKYLVVSLIIGTVACSDGSPSAPEAQVVPSSPGGLVISNPHTNSTTARLNGIHASLAASAEPNVALVSMEPGSAPDAISVAVRNFTMGGAARSVDVIDGGFDPVAVEAQVGDEIELRFLLIGGGTKIVTVKVPPRRPPGVVRTNPSKGRVDVALNNLTVTVIFSEPIDAKSLSLQSVRLLRGGIPVSGSVVPGSNSWEAEFVANNSFEPQSTYEIVVTTGIRDTDGDPLPDDYRAVFTTAEATTSQIPLSTAVDANVVAFLRRTTGELIVLPHPPGQDSWANAMNDNAQVVGRFQTGSTEHAFLWSPSQGFVDLGALGSNNPNDTPYSNATAISSIGEVVGESAGQAFRWTQSTGMEGLWSLPQFFPTGINNKGEIVGSTYTERPMRWTRSAGVQLLETLPGESGSASAINDAGQIVGYKFKWSPITEDPDLGANQRQLGLHAMLWTSTGSTILDNCTGDQCAWSAHAISQDGRILISNRGLGFLWTMSSGVSALPGSVSVGSINNLGQVLIHTAEQSFVWTEAQGMIEIGPLPGKTHTHSTGINNKGEIVGYSW